MSVSSEIERIKANIANAYTELESKGATIPTEKNSNNLASTITTVTTGGGDASINGIIEQKTVASGSVVKGDFVVATEQTRNIEFTSSNYFYMNINTVENEENMFDNSDETYATLKSNIASSHVFRFKLPSYEDFGIEANTLIVSHTISCTFNATTNASSNYVNLYGRRFLNFDASSQTSTQKYMTGNVYTKQSVNIETLSLTVDHLFYGIDMEEFGGDIYQNAAEFRIYNLFVSITYLDNGVVKTATSIIDKFVGVANSDGNEGDTIDVYVPNVGEEGVSYMMRMMETNEELEQKAQAYDILIGEE